MKANYYNEKPWGKNVPTLPGLTIKDERIFETEKQQLIALVHKFHQSDSDKMDSFPHPFFGTLTKDQWGKGMYKHLDHHLQQFGV